MPNELKRPLITTIARQTKKIDKPKIRGGYAGVMVWTIGGVVLASCTYNNNEDTNDLPAFVGDGPIAGANVFVDLNGNGVRDEDEPVAITDENGYAQLPSRYLEGYSIIADVTGAVDLETGTVLTGQFRAMPSSGSDASVIATPLTDLLAEAENPQGVLDAIFGAGVVTVADVTDSSNYRLPQGGGDIQPPQEGATAEAISDYVSQQISLASIALTELKANPSLGVAGATAELDAKQLETVLTSYFENPASFSNLRTAVEARQDKAVDINNGTPIAVGGEYRIDEDTFFRLDSVLMDDNGNIDVARIETALGFADPGGNIGAEEGVKGIFVKVKGLANASIGTGSAGEALSSLAAGTGFDTDLETLISSALGARTAENITLSDLKSSYAFVDVDAIGDLVVTPDIDYIGMVEVEYRAWDGEDVSAPATITITVTDVDEAPTGISLDRVVLLPTGGRVGVVTVTDPDAGDNGGGAYTAAQISVGGTDGALFTVSDVNGEAVLSFASGTPAETSYDIMLTASDPDDGTLTHSEAFTIQVGGVKVAGQGTGYVDGSGDGLLDENADGSTTKIEIGVLSHELTSQVKFKLATAGSGNNNDQFEITGGKLYYTGSASGNFEAGETLTVEIISNNASDSNPITESYIIHLANVDDLPVFDTPPPPVGALPSYAFTLAENADGSTTAVTVGTVSATDQDVSDRPLSYRFANGTQESGDFRLDATSGVVSYVGSGEDFEGATTRFDLMVEAVPPVGGGAASSAIASVTVTDVDEAATDISLSRSILLSAGGLIGTVTVTDPEGDSYAASDITPSDTTNFEIRTNAGTGELELHYIGVTPATQSNYSVTLTATDANAPIGTVPFSKEFNLLTTGLKITSGSETLYSGDLLASGDGLLEENADGSTTKIEIGTLSHENGNTVFDFTGSGNDNADFEITGGKLYYIGSDSGDFEAGDTLTVSIISKDSNNANEVMEDFVIHLANVNDNAPAFEVAGANLIQLADGSGPEDTWSYFVINDTTETDSVTNAETRTQEYIEYLLSGAISFASDGTLTIADGAFEVYRDVAINGVFQDHDDLFTGRRDETDLSDPFGGETPGPREPLNGQVVAYRGLTLLADEYDAHDIFYLYQDRDGNWSVEQVRADLKETHTMNTEDTSDDLTTFTTSADIGDYRLIQINADKTGFDRLNDAVTTYEITAKQVENDPTLDASDIGTHSYTLDSYAVVDIAEGTIARTATDTPVYQVRASDADNDTITYELVNVDGDLDGGAFRIDADTGMIYLKPERSSAGEFVSILDHEGQHTHNLVVRAGKEITRPDPNDPTRTITELETPEHISVMVRVTDVDEGPYDIEIRTLPSFARDVNIGSEAEAARLVIRDQDGLTAVIDDPDNPGTLIRSAVDAYSPDDINLEGADEDHFKVKKGDDDGELILVYTGGADNIKNSYDLKVIATDPNAVMEPTLMKDITFSSLGTILFTDDGTEIPSGFLRDNGNGFLKENSDGSSTRIKLGLIGHEAGHTKFVLARDAQGNFAEDNADFEIEALTKTRYIGADPQTYTEYTLYYKGSDSGNFEAGDTLTVRITASEPIAAVNPDSTSVATEDFVINLLDEAEFTSPEIAAQSFSVAAGTSVSSAIGTVSATDLDGDSITYSLAAGLEDNNKFEINATTGEVTAKTGQISAYASGDSYKIVVLASNSKDDRPSTDEEVAEITDQPYVFLHGLILARKDGANLDGNELAPEDMDIDFIPKTTNTAEPPFVSLFYRSSLSKLSLLSKSSKDRMATLEEIHDTIADGGRAHAGVYGPQLHKLVEVRYATDAAGNEIGDRGHVINFNSQVEPLLFQDYEVITIDVV